MNKSKIFDFSKNVRCQKRYLIIVRFRLTQYAFKVFSSRFGINCVGNSHKLWFHDLKNHLGMLIENLIFF